MARVVAVMVMVVGEYRVELLGVRVFAGAEGGKKVNKAFCLVL